MNILILARESHVGGLLNYSYLLAKGLSQKSNTNVVIGITPSDAVGPLRAFNLQEINLESKSPIGIIKNYRQIARIIKDYKIDIIQAHNRIPALYAWLYCSFHRKVKYLWVNLVLPIPTSLVYRLTTKYGECAVTGADGVQPLVEGLKIPKNKVKVVRFGTDLSKFIRTSPETQIELKKKLGIKNNEKVILLYGRLDKIKGHEYLLDSLRLLKNDNYKVIFPGQNPEYKKYLEDIIRNYNLGERIIFPGFVNGQEYLSISDLMVLPSEKDGLSFAFIETITMGVPVIRTNTGDYSKYVKDLCFWVNYGEVESLAQLIDEFLDGDEKFSEKAALAQKESGRFGVENMVNDYYDIYCSILEK